MDCMCLPLYSIVAQSCAEYSKIFEALEPTYKVLEEHSTAITAVWFNTSYVHSNYSYYYNHDGSLGRFICERAWNRSKLINHGRTICFEFSILI